MKLRLLLGGIMVACLAIVAASPAHSAAKSKAKAKPSGPPSPADMDAMMKKFEMLAAPGAPHRALESLVGMWEVTTRAWMDPKAPPPFFPSQIYGAI